MKKLKDLNKGDVFEFYQFEGVKYIVIENDKKTVRYKKINTEQPLTGNENKYVIVCKL